MTDRIDLDDLAEATDDGAEQRNRGDWLWRQEGDPDDELAAQAASDAGGDGEGTSGSDEVPMRDTGGSEGSEGRDASAGDTAATDRTARPMPHVPRPNKDKPVGIPVEGGGAGGGQKRGNGPVSGTADSGSIRRGRSGGGGDTVGADDEYEDAHAARRATESVTAPTTSGPHGGGVDDMTLAITYSALTRLADPARAVADATRWTDWIGIVGDVEAHVINKFQRDHDVDVDFFNGSGTGPGERLAEIDRRSMFFAQRMVVVGVEGTDEPIAGEAGWEFVSLGTAAEKAGWELAE